MSLTYSRILQQDVHANPHERTALVVATVTPRSPSVPLQTHAIPISDRGDGASLPSHAVSNATHFYCCYDVLGTGPAEGTGMYGKRAAFTTAKELIAQRGRRAHL